MTEKPSEQAAIGSQEATSAAFSTKRVRHLTQTGRARIWGKSPLKINECKDEGPLANFREIIFEDGEPVDW